MCLCPWLLLLGACSPALIYMGADYLTTFDQPIFHRDFVDADAVSISSASIGAALIINFAVGLVFYKEGRTFYLVLFAAVLAGITVVHAACAGMGVSILRTHEDRIETFYKNLLKGVEEGDFSEDDLESIRDSWKCCAEGYNKSDCMENHPGYSGNCLRVGTHMFYWRMAVLAYFGLVVVLLELTNLFLAYREWRNWRRPVLFL